MCNMYEQMIAWEAYCAALQAAELGVPESELPSDLPPADNIKIRDMAPVIRAAGNGAALASMRWAWLSPNKKPVFNYVSEDRHFEGVRRCLIPASAFFEFTGSKYPKAKHRFTLNGAAFLCIAGIWRAAGADEPETFTMLTTAPGPDIAPYHDRQVVVLRPEDWAAWLFLTKPEAELLRPLPAGSLTAETVRAGA